jgi:uncharacterized protein with ATP-grasp and redox domains
MSKNVNEEEFKDFKDKEDVTEENEIELTIKGTVLIMEDNSPGGAHISCSLVGRADALIASIVGTMETEEEIRDIIMKAAKHFAMKKISAEINKGSDWDIDKDKDISDEDRDKLDLSQLFSGLKPDTEC